MCLILADILAKQAVVQTTPSKEGWARYQPRGRWSHDGDTQKETKQSEEGEAAKSALSPLTIVGRKSEETAECPDSLPQC